MKILELYKELAENRRRFIDEIFDAEVYKRTNPSLNIVDLGAFEGEYSFSCLPFAKNIWAIEPDPVPFKRLVELVEKYEIKQMKCFPIGIHEKSGMHTFHASGGGGSSMMEPNSADDKALQIETLTLNDFLLREQIDHVDILKIDVESSEGPIFRAEDFPEAADKITTIIGEPHAGEEVRPLLEKFGFKVNFWPEHTFTATR